MDIYVWLGYLGAVIIVALTPGPSVLLAMAHGVSYGTAKACVTIFGAICGFTLLMLISTLGLGAVLASYAPAFIALKLLGAVYLLYIGAKQISQSHFIALTQTAMEADTAPNNRFRQGVCVAMSNPKVILFYLSFLPQFIDLSKNISVQIAILAASFAVVEFAVELIAATFSIKLLNFMDTPRSQKIFNSAIGTFFIIIGVSFIINAVETTL